MLFNSIEFAIFLPIVFFLYWIVNKNLRLQNTLLLAASYFFYAAWDYRFLFLLMFSTMLDYFTGIKIHESEGGKKKFWLWLSICVNLGFLGVFKYYNFFIASFTEAVSPLGFQVNASSINVILPVGISFYTFHGLSYVIDLYYDRIKPEKNFIDYAVFVSFFPLLVAGPIERATHLLPQIKQKRTFDYAKAVDGLRQILWGLFKKIVIADNCATYVNEVFNHPDNFTGSTKVMAAVFFAFQIYCDFSGYSDIALGAARLFGIELLRNFAFPYFSRDIAEFWRRWHISLTSWFRDYVYIPLGGSKGGTWKKIRNVFIIFILSGFWHGANWTFIIWGFINACYYIPLLLLNINRGNTDTVAEGSLLPSFKEFVQMIATFSLTLVAWIFFRANSVATAVDFLKHIFSKSLFTIPQMISFQTLGLLGLFILIEWVQREKKHALEFNGIKLPRVARWGIYYAIITLIVLFGGSPQEFIYFQF